MAQQDVTDPLEAVHGKNLRHCSSVEENLVIDEKGGRATPPRHIPVAAEHFQLHGTGLCNVRGRIKGHLLVSIGFDGILC